MQYLHQLGLPGFVISWLTSYGYLVIGVMLLLENIGLPVVPGETTLIAGALLAGAGGAGPHQLNVVAVGVVGVVACFVGADIGYGIGRFGGQVLVLRYGKYVFIRPHHIARAEDAVDRFGGVVVVAARFVVGLRELNGIIAGTTRMRWTRFLICNAIGAVAWVACWVSVGYLAGNHIHALITDVSTYSRYLLTAAGVFAAALVVRAVLRRRRRGTHPSPSPAADAAVPPTAGASPTESGVSAVANDDFSGRTVYVFGAAGALGGGLASAFLAAGAEVTAVDRATPEPGRRLAGVRYVAASVLDDTALAELFDSAPAPWAVVNTVGGFAPHVPMAKLDQDVLFGQLELNLVSAALVTKHALRVMVPAGQGRLVHTASRAGLVTKGSGFAYSVSKLGVLHLVKMAAEEVQGSGVTVNCVVPSIIDTPANRAAIPGADHASWPKVPDIAQTYLFLASPRTHLTNGAAIPV